MKRLIFLSIAAVTLTYGCGSKSSAPKAPDVETSKEVTIKIKRLDRDFAALNVNNLSPSIPTLKAKYGDFIEIFTDGILGIGKTNDPEFTNGLHAFLTYPVVQEAFHTSNEIFNKDEIAKIEGDLTDAFSRYKGTFPNKSIPSVCTYVAGFNQSVVVTDSMLAIGLDKYLGANYENYQSMGFPRYLTSRMVKEYIPVDAMFAWISSDYPIKNEHSSLLAHMIHQGKLVYLTQQMMPKVADTLLFGFTTKQMKWVNKNERFIWEILVSQKLLFNTEPMVRTRLVGEAPFTSIYGADAPGKAAVWQGYRIVLSYMKNTHSSLADLMKEDNAQKILEIAKYKP